MKFALLLAALQADPAGLIEKLGAEKVEERDEAERRLKDLGRAALEGLEKAFGHKDPEIASRARRIHELIRRRLAEEAYGKVAEPIGKAATVSLRFAGSVENRGKGVEGKTQVEGTLLLKEGNKVHLSAKGATDGKPFEVLVVSDGATVFTRLGGEENRRKAPAAFRERLLVTLQRLGACESVFWVGLYASEDPEGIGDAARHLRTGDYEERKGGEGTGVLAYRARFHEATYEVELAYDLKSLVPVRRTLKGRGITNEYTATESCSEFALTADIPDEKFRLPGK